MLKSLAEGLIDTLGLVVTLGLLSGLLLESLTLFSGNVQLSVAIVCVSNSFVFFGLELLTHCKFPSCRRKPRIARKGQERYESSWQEETSSWGDQ